MYEHFEETLIAHCAATLAGHKVGSLFSYRIMQGDCAKHFAATADDMLRPRGLRVRLLRHCGEACLVYVYRPHMLRSLLESADVSCFLAGYGYHGNDPEQALCHLSGRIHCKQDFPHEIGVFLGYPLADVTGFIEHKGNNCCCQGLWKAYSDAEGARRRFALYLKCRDVYLSCYKKGFPVTRLAVGA